MLGSEDEVTYIYPSLKNTIVVSSEIMLDSALSSDLGV